MIYYLVVYNKTKQNKTYIHVLQCPVDSARTQCELPIDELEDTLIT